MTRSSRSSVPPRPPGWVRSRPAATRPVVRLLLAGLVLLAGMVVTGLPDASAAPKDRSALPLKGCKRTDCHSTTTTAPATEPAPTTTAPAPTTTAPVPTGTLVEVPSTWAYAINSGGGCPTSTSATDDVTDRINTLVNDRTKVPANSTVRLTANGCYRLDRAISIRNFSGLTLEGANATFQRFAHADRVYPYTWGYPHLTFAEGTNLTVRDLSVKGLNTVSFVNDSNYATWSWLYEPYKFGAGCSDNCFESGFIVTTIDGLLMENINIDAVFGDGITVGGEHDSDLVRNGVLRNIDIDRNGRQGVSPTTVDGVLLDDVNILHGYAVAYDPEVNGTGRTRNLEIRNSYANIKTVVISVGSRGAENIYFHDNYIKNLNPSYPWAAFDNGPVSGIRLVNNTVENRRTEIVSIVLANASGTNEISGNVSRMAEPPTVRQLNRYAAVAVGNAITSGGQNGSVTGTVVIKNNDFTRYTDVTTANNSSAQLIVCSNKLSDLAGFTSPSIC